MKLITVALLFLLTIPGLAAPKPVAFDFIEIPGATNVFPGGINDTGDISGYLNNQNGVVGFLKQGNQVTHISVPGDTVTRPWGLDNDGRVTGSYYDSPYGPSKGFLYQNGQYITFTRGTDIYPIAVSDGKVVGFFTDGSATHGFLYVNGQFTQLDYPGALSTLPWGINQSGKIVGRWGGPFPESRGFSYLNGEYQEINFPRINASTELQAISNSDIIVGGVSGGCTFFDQFMLVRNKFSLLALPSGAWITGINAEGTVVGWLDGKGFIAKASKFILRGN